MSLSTNLIDQFVKVTNDKTTPKKEEILYGTAVISDGETYVRLDGSNILTPVISTADVKNSDRVTVMIKDHNAVITGNISSPAARFDDLADLSTDVENHEERIIIAYGLIADKANIKDLEATEARIEELIADKATIESLEAVNAEIKNLKVEKLDVEVAEAEYLKVDTAELKYATIENLDATNANIHNLEVDFGDFKKLTTNDFNAIDATIKNLKVDKLDADIAKIDKAWVEQLIIKGGFLSQSGTVFELVGVHISGDLIDAHTLKADRLLLKNSKDGLYYELNTDGGTITAEQLGHTEEELQNGLLGSNIVSHTITAEQLTVNNIVGTGGWINMAEGTFHYWDPKTGNGISWDGKNLDIKANRIHLGASDSFDLEEELDKVVSSSKYQFYQSESPVNLIGGTWTYEHPIWSEGKYIWIRTIVTYRSGKVEYQPNDTGVCITGNTGKDGIIASGSEPADKTKVWLDTSAAPPVLKRWNNSDWEIINEINIGGKNLLRKTAISKSAHSIKEKAAEQKLEYGYLDWEMPSDLIKKGDEVTVSFEIKTSNGTDKVSVWTREEHPLYAAGHIKSIIPTKEWVKHVYTFTRQSEKDWYGLLFQNSSSSITENTGIMYVRNAKLERGNKATDWSPAPEDLEGLVDDLDIGGRNFLRNTQLLDSPVRIYNSLDGGKYVDPVDDPSSNFNYAELLATEDGNSTFIKWITWVDAPIFKDNIIDKDIVLTFEYQCEKKYETNDSHFCVEFFLNNKPGTVRIYYKLMYQKVEETSTWNRFTLKSTITHDFFDRVNGEPTVSKEECKYVVLRIYGNKAYDIKIRKLQLELGNKATDWSPNPSDIQEDFVTQLQNVNNKLTTSLQQTQDSITSTVERISSLEGETDALSKSISKLEQTSDGFKATVEKNYATKGDIGNKLDKSEFDSLKNWLTYDDKQLTLGQEGSKTKLNLQNSAIKFIENENTISTWGNDAFNADNGFFDVSLQIGNFAFTPRKNGSLSFGKVSDN